MKTKFSIIFMWLFTILFISCDKLDLYPEDSLSPTTYFKNENELQTELCLEGNHRSFDSRTVCHDGNGRPLCDFRRRNYR